MLPGKALYVTCEETCFNMTADESMEVAEQQSTQEEAYTSLLLHAMKNLHAFHAAKTGSKTVIITLSRRHRCHVALSCFPKGYHQSLSHEQTVLAIGRQRCDSLIGLHAFTSYDTMSEFSS